MPSPSFRTLATQLFDAGIAPKYITRLKAELQDHYTDLEAEARRARKPPADAAIEARARLGDDASIADQFVRRPELKSWIYRSSLAMNAIELLACVLVLLIAPFLLLSARKAVLARYCAAGSAACMLTAALLLAMRPVVPANSQAAIAAAMHRSLPPAGNLAAPPMITMPVPLAAAPPRPQPLPRPSRPVYEPPPDLPPITEAAEATIDSPMLAFEPLSETPFDIPSFIADTDYMPIVKVAPIYPSSAAALGIEGYVVIEYTVTRAGSVDEVVVIESSNSLFHRAAIEAAYKFRYHPRVVRGQTVDVVGVRSKITFKLEA